ncbi:MAG: nicotinamide mononucleotide transporter [Bacteroidales bacterium]|jgi:nicotinamide mononucleotide transporter|nr:nicotinamide mononucleotide transporter [Bacteroidales bacterium]
MNWLDLISSVLGLTCVFLAGRNSKYNFWVGYLYTASLFFLFWDKSLYASLLLQPVSLAINILGHYRWTHPKEDEQSSQDASALKVSSLSPSAAVICVAGTTLVAGLWGLTLDKLFPADPHPYLDCLVTALILLAQLLSSLKKWECWIVWLLVNITQIILHISVGNVFMPIVCGLYLINGLWSLATWLKLYRNKA